MKKYFYDDLRAMTPPAREMWMCDQCSEFGKTIENLISERERESFTEEMNRKLRQLAKRWTSWNHRTFGDVTSRKSVSELLGWEQSTKLLTNPVVRTGSVTPEANILRTFHDLCERFEELSECFTHDILEPLCDFFQPSAIAQNDKLNHVNTELKELVTQWKELLAPGPVDPTLFSEESSKCLEVFILRGRSYNYDAIIRLVPDLLEKVYQALEFARQWRLLYKEHCLTREGTYTVLDSRRVSRKEQREQLESRKRIIQLERESEEVKSQCKNLQSELGKCQERCENLEHDLEFYTLECERLEAEVQETKTTCEEAKTKLENAKTDCEHSTGSLANTNQYCQVLQQELNACKIKYCTQKIKLVNAKKRCASLADQMEKARKDYDALKMEEELSEKRDQMLQNQLEVLRKNIRTQATMVDSLQQQCYTLKKELDRSTSAFKKVTEELKTTNERCDMFESNLRWSEEEREKLRSELDRASGREKLLRRENANLCKARFTSKARDSTPDIICTLNTPERI